MSRLPKTAMQAVILALLGSAACKPHSHTDEADGSATAPPSRPVTTGPIEPETRPGVEEDRPSDLVVMRMGEETVTFADLDLAIRRRALLEGVSPGELAPASRWRDPYFLGRMADAVLQERRLLAEGERLALLPGPEDLEAAWLAHPRLSALAGPGLERVVEAGLGAADVLHLLRAELVHERWVALVIDRLEDATVWEEYQFRHDTVTVEAVALPNVPTRGELAAFLAGPEVQTAVEREYADYPGRYEVPESVEARIVRVRVGPEASEEDWAAARQRAEVLRAEVLDGADMVTMSRQPSDDTAADGDGLLTRVVERQNPEVFAQDEGAIGPLMRDAGGWAFYRVEARHPPWRRPLDELLRREIATARLVRTRALRLAQERASRVLATLRGGGDDALRELLDLEGLRLETIGPVQREGDGLLAGIGRSEALQSELFALAEPGDTVAAPVLIEGTVWVARLVERGRPERADFEVERADFEAELHALVRVTAWDAFWSERLAETRPTLELPADYFEDKPPVGGVQ